ncbi:LysM peptidoglycan-binding domain-containing protein [Lampropedia puyangensis]|uniref:LysM peptidoglycan-binding domain-containing protein n=1 Tax=Lampropedia puyangensis TaxID=1330072 RepID=A0A4S8F5U4_9BURK|nr:peptidoglycan DD-metalloendopeptidase family protein [Lampropedia puyangensis]THU01965.1 LysM peptidoglycan-binding domain-containing protein [Lampropedia puyangensis]
MLFQTRWVGVGAIVAACALVAGCSGVSLNEAPVEDRAGSGQVGSVAPVAAAPAGHYTVKPGDTLIRIGLETGQSWKDIAAWNQLANADVIEVGQTLRVVPPGTNVAASNNAASAPAGSGVQVRPIPPSGGSSSTGAGATTSTAPVTTVAATAPAANTSGIQFVWPASGPLLAGFNEASNKGYDIGGNAGDAVLAAADGHVVYAGAGLRGYGNLIILKHNDEFLTAYAHNRALLVKEDQRVTRGQKIAEMGNTDADRVKLHFEVRRQGKPVNPAGYLPKR